MGNEATESVSDTEAVQKMELRKPLDDTSRKFWLKLKETLVALGLKVMPGDEAFYYIHEKGELMGAVLTHVDDFFMIENNEFVEKLRVGIAEVLTVSMVERDRF